MEISELDKQKNILLSEVEPLIKLQKKLYSNVDITTPLSQHEKELKEKIQNIFSQINQIVFQKRKLLKLK